MWIMCNLGTLCALMSSEKIEIYRDAFSTTLRKKRNSLNISQEELADRAGAAVRYIGHLERKTRQPTISVLCELAYALETTPSEFMVEIEETLPEDFKKSRNRVVANKD